MKNSQYRYSRKYSCRHLRNFVIWYIQPQQSKKHRISILFFHDQIITKGIAGYIFIVSIYFITFVNLRRNVVVIWKMSYEKYREALDFVEVGMCPFPISIYCSDLDSVSLICLVLAMSSLRSHSVLRLKKIINTYSIVFIHTPRSYKPFTKWNEG